MSGRAVSIRWVRTCLSRSLPFSGGRDSTRCCSAAVRTPNRRITSRSSIKCVRMSFGPRPMYSCSKRTIPAHTAASISPCVFMTISTDTGRMVATRWWSSQITVPVYPIPSLSNHAQAKVAYTGGTRIFTRTAPVELQIDASRSLAVASFTDEMVVWPHARPGTGLVKQDRQYRHRLCIRRGSDCRSLPGTGVCLIKAKHAYCEPARPFLDAGQKSPSLTTQHKHDDLSDLSDVIGKRISFGRNAQRTARLVQAAYEQARKVRQSRHVGGPRYTTRVTGVADSEAE